MENEFEWTEFALQSHYLIKCYGETDQLSGKQKEKTNEPFDDFHEVERALLQVQSTAQSRGQLTFFYKGPDTKYFQLAGHILFSLPLWYERSQR